jgi:hypothetical protein
MKAKNFRFQQTVVAQVTTRYDYKIKAKNLEEAQEIMGKYIDKKVKKGKAHMPVKQLDPSKIILEVIPVSPENLEKGSVIVELAANVKKGIEGKVVYNNKTSEGIIPFIETSEETKEEGKESKE